MFYVSKKINVGSFFLSLNKSPFLVYIILKKCFTIITSTRLRDCYASLMPMVPLNQVRFQDSAVK